jgi:hypothetical protein
VETKRQKTGGRTKGTPNKATKALKDMILGALDGVGGENYLRQQASENPTAFLTLVGKVLPLQLSGDPANPIHTKSSMDVSGLSDEQLHALASIKVSAG